MNTPENIQSLKSNEIFVFGSNTLGRHGAGAASLSRQALGARIRAPCGNLGLWFGSVSPLLSGGGGTNAKLINNDRAEPLFKKDK